MPKRKAPHRAAEKDPYSLGELLTSENSALIDIDLHGKLAAYFSSPSNWVEIPPADQDFIRSILPPNVELNDDGSIPTPFWKYNSEFRLNCRNLQEDLRAGRMDPEWQRQAHQAMEERAAGKFDASKEREFERYWGQKQKVDYNYLAGHASKVRLEELLRAGLFHEDDIWSFDHTFGRGESAVMIQKDCRIVKLTDKTVILAIPPGQHRFARRHEHVPTPNQVDTVAQRDEESTPRIEDTTDEGPLVHDATAMKVQTNGDSKSLETAVLLKNDEDSMNGAAGDAGASMGEACVKQDRGTAAVLRSAITDIETGGTTADAMEAQAPDNVAPKVVSGEDTGSVDAGVISAAGGSNKTSSFTKEYDVILYEISGLYALERKILEFDGRAKPGSRTGSTWRDIRCRRNEQDMGSLFEMRDEYYAYRCQGK
ncbi:MAG: hypothetical protein Q9220_007772 [cf. Caloplaca sp. 1 TL-2023]